MDLLRWKLVGSIGKGSKLKYLVYSFQNRANSRENLSACDRVYNEHTFSTK